MGGARTTSTRIASDLGVLVLGLFAAGGVAIGRLSPAWTAAAVPCLAGGLVALLADAGRRGRAAGSSAAGTPGPAAVRLRTMTLAVLVAATPSGVLLMGIDVVVIAVPAAFGLLALHEGLEVFDARRDRAAARPESP